MVKYSILTNDRLRGGSKLQGALYREIVFLPFFSSYSEDYCHDCLEKVRWQYIEGLSWER